MSIRKIKRKKAIMRKVTIIAYQLFKYLGIVAGTVGVFGAVVSASALDTEGDAFKVVLSTLIASIAAIVASFGFGYLSQALWANID